MPGFLFLLAIDRVMRETTGKTNTGIRRKMMEQLEDLEFADDIALISTTQNQMQRKTDKLSESAKRVGLNISKTKTRVLKMNCKNNNPIKFQDGETIQEVSEFEYLGATMSNDEGADKDMQKRLSKAKSSFTWLKKIWGSKQYNKRTKIKLYNTLVNPVLLCGWETRKINENDNKKLDSFQYQCLKRIMGIFWPYIVSIEELNEKTNSERISIGVKKRRWRWLGHVLRMPRQRCSWLEILVQVRQLATDKVRWRKSMTVLCATEHEAEMRWGENPTNSNPQGKQEIVRD